MSQLVAIDVAVLLPQDVSGRAIELSAMLAGGDPQALRLGAGCLPHITLTQQFVGAVSLDACLDAVGVVLQGVAPLHMSVTGVGRGNTTVWMSVERSPALLDLHRRLMDALETFEQTDGAADAFVGNARPKDIEWVRSYRRASSGKAFTPHITLGHSTQTTPLVEPLTFEAATIAACQLGRFCSCGRVLRRWTL
ncbi:MAG TPA: 2'-5' RNA ligase family protein [Vicinamibacterales bacterium]|nr:2'-5' RNA ligase family protein [Vicinamibacterales bacterium]